MAAGSRPAAPWQGSRPHARHDLVKDGRSVVHLYDAIGPWTHIDPLLAEIEAGPLSIVLGLGHRRSRTL